MKSQVLHTVWCNISGEAAGEFWHWSLLGVKGLRVKTLSSNRSVQGLSWTTNFSLQFLRFLDSTVVKSAWLPFVFLLSTLLQFLLCSMSYREIWASTRRTRCWPTATLQEIPRPTSRGQESDGSGRLLTLGTSWRCSMLAPTKMLATMSAQPTTELATKGEPPSVSLSTVSLPHGHLGLFTELQCFGQNNNIAVDRISALWRAVGRKMTSTASKVMQWVTN